MDDEDRAIESTVSMFILAGCTNCGRRLIGFDEAGKQVPRHSTELLPTHGENVFRPYCLECSKVVGESYP